MNIFDLIIFLPIIYGLIRGLFKGFVKEIVSLAAIFIAFLAAEIFNAKFAILLQSLTDLSDKTAIFAAYLLIFVATLILALLISNIIHKLLKALSLGWLNSILGAGLGTLKWALLISIAMNVFDAVDSKFHFANEEKKEGSLAFYPIQKLAPSLWDITKE